MIYFRHSLHRVINFISLVRCKPDKTGWVEDYLLTFLHLAIEANLPNMICKTYESTPKFSAL